MAQGAAGIGGRAKVEVVDPHIGCELEAALGRQTLVVPVKDKVAQTSAWPSGGLFQRQGAIQAAPSFSQPRPINRSGTRWHPNPTASHIGLAFGTAAITYRRGLLYCSAGPGPLCVLLDCSRPRSRLGRDEMWRLLKRVVLPADPLPEEATQYYT